MLDVIYMLDVNTVISIILCKWSQHSNEKKDTIWI